MKKAIIAITALMTLLSCGGQKGKEVTNKNKKDMTQITYHKMSLSTVSNIWPRLSISSPRPSV